MSKRLFPIPYFNAVVTFVIDMTGSMMGRPNEMAKELIFNITSFLKANYEEVDVHLRFVGFDTEAHEFSEQEVWTKFLGGGTYESVGIEKAGEILSEYDNAQWNKYLYFVGDGGNARDNNTALIDQIRKLYPDLRHMGYTQVDAYNWFSDPAGPQNFTSEVAELAKELKWLDFAILPDQDGGIMKVLETYFGKGRKREGN